MKKNQIWKSERCLLAALVLCLTAGGASLFAQNSVVSQSPLGVSRLAWVTPESGTNRAAVQSKVQDLSEDADQNFTQTAEAPAKVPVKVASPIPALTPIRQVRLLEKTDAAQKVSPAPVTLAMATDAEEEEDVTDSRNTYKRETFYADECPDPHKMVSILEMGYKVVPSPGEFPVSCPVPDEVYTRKLPTPIVFTWKASALCHKPLYFEDVQLERYGHTLCPILQPALSGARFWLTIPLLPYLMGTYPPTECIYDLGYYRPGSCAPNMIQPLPISLRGGLIEAGAAVGGAALIP